MKYLNVLLVVTLCTLLMSATCNAIVLLDENFQTPLASNGTPVQGTIAGWTSAGANPADLYQQSSNNAPGDTNYTTNQVAYLEYNGATGYLEHDLGHTWSSTDVYQISLNAMSSAWSITAQRWIQPRLIETVSGDVLWEAPQDASSELYWWDLNDGPNPYAWNGPGPFGNSTWQQAEIDYPGDAFFSFTINAADFVTGTEGSNIELQLNSLGQRGVTVDNVTVELIPEPTSLALFGFGYLTLWFFRRKR
jgi:hypothetical protein